MEPELKALLEKHYQRTLAAEERKTLHVLLAKKFEYGECVSYYCCTICGAPIVRTWDWGFECLWWKGGCGKGVPRRDVRRRTPPLLKKSSASARSTLSFLA